MQLFNKKLFLLKFIISLFKMVLLHLILFSYWTMSENQLNNIVLWLYDIACIFDL